MSECKDRPLTYDEIANVLKTYAWEDCAAYYCANVCPHRDDVEKCEASIDENDMLCHMGDDVAVNVFLDFIIENKDKI